MPVASLLHLDRPTSEDLDNHRTRQVALANRPTTQEAGSLVNLLQHHLLLSALLSQPKLGLARVILAAASLDKSLQQVAASLDKVTLLQRPSRVAASLVLQEGLAASVQRLAPGPFLVPATVYSVAIISSSSNSRSRFHLVGQLPPLEEVSERATLASAPITILRTPVVVYSATRARQTLHLGKTSSSQLKQIHSADLGLRTKTRLILHQPLGPSVRNSNKSKSRAGYLAIRMQIPLAAAYLGTRTKTINSRPLQEVSLVTTITINRQELHSSRPSQLQRVLTSSGRVIQAIQIRVVVFSLRLAITTPTRILLRINQTACSAATTINSKSRWACLAVLQVTQVAAYLAI